MALPAPNLDDRSFQQLVDDAKRQIGLRCPEWTEHNVSDPGVTLIELFASMFEMTLFRLNQVPELHQVRFLELLGLSLEPPTAAGTDLRFRLTAPLSLPGQGPVRLPARATQAGTLRTEEEASIEFVTDVDVTLGPPELRAVLAIAGDDELAQPKGARRMEPNERRENGAGFPVFSSVPKGGDAVYFGLGPGLERHIVALDLECLTAAASGLNESYPAQVWEIWDATRQTWSRAEVVEDTTFGLNRNGSVEVAIPPSAGTREIGGIAALWLRARYTLDPDELPPVGADRLRPSEYRRSPEVILAGASTVGAQVPATNCNVITDEPLGLSDAVPGQTFRLRERPILEPQGDETVETGTLAEDGLTLENPVRWTRVTDFARSGPEDRHVVIDTLNGEVQFGPNLRLPEGGTRQYGAIPLKGHAIRMNRYRHGGGSAGNVREERVRTLRHSIPYIANVTNPRPAMGGRDLETMEHAKMRVRELLHTRERAVTAEDFEALALRATSKVGRARCVFPTADGDLAAPGTVRVLLAPRLGPQVRRPMPKDLAIPDATLRETQAFLDERRLLTTRLELSEPTYRYVSVHLRLVADPQADPDMVRELVTERLDGFINPLSGGPSANGWPFRRALNLADVYAQVATVRGVAFLLDARMFVSDVLDASTNALGPERRIDAPEGLRLVEGELICTREHRVTVVPMSLVGREPEEEI